MVSFQSEYFLDSLVDPKIVGGQFAPSMDCLSSDVRKYSDTQTTWHRLFDATCADFSQVYLKNILLGVKTVNPYSIGALPTSFCYIEQVDNEVVLSREVRLGVNLISQSTLRKMFHSLILLCHASDFTRERLKRNNHMNWLFPNGLPVIDVLDYLNTNIYEWWRQGFLHSSTVIQFQKWFLALSNLMVRPITYTFYDALWKSTQSWKVARQLEGQSWRHGSNSSSTVVYTSTKFPRSLCQELCKKQFLQKVLVSGTRKKKKKNHQMSQMILLLNTSKTLCSMANELNFSGKKHNMEKTQNFSGQSRCRKILYSTRVHGLKKMIPFLIQHNSRRHGPQRTREKKYLNQRAYDLFLTSIRLRTVSDDFVGKSRIQSTFPISDALSERRSTQDQYSDFLTSLYNIEKAKIQWNADATRQVLSAFGNPQAHLSFVCVCGSAGKTFIASQLSSRLVSSRLNVGLCTCPHMVTLRERISVNGRWIRSSDLIVLFSKICSVVNALKISMISYHEIIFIMACVYYQQKKCSLAIIEIYNLPEDAPHPLTYVDAPLVYCSVITTIECSSNFLVTRENLTCLGHQLATYLNLPFMAHTKVVCGPLVTKAIQMISACFPGFLKNLRTSELIFLRFNSQEMFLQENERIVQATLKQLHSLDFPTIQKVRKPFPLCRFQMLHYRTQQLAARHIHYYLQFIYNASRSLHFSWRLLALKHPELFVHVFHMDATKPVQIFPGQSDYFSQLLKELYRPSSDDRKDLLLQSPSISKKLTPFLFGTNKKYDPKGFFFSSKEFYYWKNIIRAVVCGTRKVNFQDIGKAWRNPLCVKGALYFLKYCSDSVEDWPNYYTKRLPFDNWIDSFQKKTKYASVQKIESLKCKQKGLIQSLQKLNKRKEKALCLYSFDRFSAYHNEKLYWSFQQVAELRENNSKSLRSSETFFFDRCNSITKHTQKDKKEIICAEAYGNQDIPSQIERKEFLIKNKIQYLDQCIFELQHLPSVLPTPPMTLIDCPSNKMSFERCFLDFRQQFSGSSVRICFVLTRDQPLSSLNSLYSILNDPSYNSIVPNCTIKGLHLLQARHPTGKSITQYLQELEKCDELNEKLSQMMLQTLKDQIEYQLCLSPPVSPLPKEILKLLVTQRMKWTRNLNHVKTTRTDIRIQEIKKKIHKKLSYVYGKQKVSEDVINNYILHFLKWHPVYTKTMSLITKYLPSYNCRTQYDTTFNHSVGQPYQASYLGNLRVIRRMHRLCETLKTSQTNDLRLRMKKNLHCIQHGNYLTYTKKKPLKLLHSTMSWNSLWSLVAMHPLKKFYMEACHNIVLKTCGEDFSGLSKFLTPFTQKNKNKQHACHLISFYTLPAKCSLIFSILKKWEKKCQWSQTEKFNSPNRCRISNTTKSVKWIVSRDINFLIHQGAQLPFQVCIAEFYQQAQSKQLFIKTTYKNQTIESFNEDKMCKIFEKVFIPIETYCHAITRYVWYQAYKFSKTKKSYEMLRYAIKRIISTKTPFRFHSYSSNSLDSYIQRYCQMLRFKRIHFVWSDIYGIILLIMYTTYYLSKCSYTFETTLVSKRPLWLPRISFEKKENCKNPCYETYFLNVLKDFIQSELLNKSLNISEPRLRHLIDNEEGSSKITLNVLQKGDLPLQLSVAFQKAATERSILLICSHSSLCSEVLETLGMTLVLKKKDVSCEYFSYLHHKNTILRETLLPSFPCWYDAKLASHYFSKGFATLSAAALLGNVPNDYLKQVHIKRKKNELKRQKDLTYYRQLKYKDM